MNQTEMKLNISLTITETNTVLRALGMLPYNDVAQLIQSIKTQGDQQVAQSATPATPTE